MASSGPRYPTAASSGGGGGEFGADDVTKLWAADGNKANFSAIGDGYGSDYTGGSTLGFSIPLDATITGFVTQIVLASGSNMELQFIGISKSATTNVNTSLVGKTIAIPLTGTPTTYSHGASNDLWGTTWTPAQVNAASFGVVFYMSCVGGFGSADIDAVNVTVHFTQPVGETSNGIIYLLSSVTSLILPAFGRMFRAAPLHVPHRLIRPGV